MEIIAQPSTAEIKVGQAVDKRTNHKIISIGQKNLPIGAKIQKRNVLGGRKCSTNKDKRRPGHRKLDYHFPAAFFDYSYSEYRKTANTRPNMLKQSMQNKIAKAQRALDAIYSVAGWGGGPKEHTIADALGTIRPHIQKINKIMPKLLKSRNMEYMRKQIRKETNETTLSEAIDIISLFLYKKDIIEEQAHEYLEAAKGGIEKRKMKQTINKLHNKTFKGWEKKMKQLSDLAQARCDEVWEAERKSKK